MYRGEIDGQEVKEGSWRHGEAQVEVILFQVFESGLVRTYAGRGGELDIQREKRPLLGISLVNSRRVSSRRQTPGLLTSSLGILASSVTGI